MGLFTGDSCGSGPAAVVCAVIVCVCLCRGRSRGRAQVEDEESTDAAEKSLCPNTGVCTVQCVVMFVLRTCWFLGLTGFLCDPQS